MADQTLAMFGLPGGIEWVVIGVFGLLLFGRRLPEIARSVGKSIVEFKKGMRDVKNDIDASGTSAPKILSGGGDPSMLESHDDPAIATSQKRVEKPASPREDSTE